MKINRLLLNQFAIFFSTILLAIGLFYASIYNHIIFWMGVLIIKFFYIYIPGLAILLKMLYSKAKTVAVIIGIIGVAIFLAGIPSYFVYMYVP